MLACPCGGLRASPKSSVLEIANFPWFAAREAGSMGKPAPLYDIDLVGPDGRPCDDGEEGEIITRNIQAPGLFRGYYRTRSLDPAAAFKGGRVQHRGRCVADDHDGYFWFVGRNDDVIKCSG
jgi:acetyl-CoA synthetase